MGCGCNKGKKARKYEVSFASGAPAKVYLTEYEARQAVQRAGGAAAASMKTLEPA